VLLLLLLLLELELAAKHALATEWGHALGRAPALALALKWAPAQAPQQVWARCLAAEAEGMAALSVVAACKE
jgi:hypothetical protein